MDSVNSRIKELRIKLNMTQDEFGNAIGLSKSGVSNIENGTRAISKRHIKLICSAFSVQENWLETGNTPVFIKDTVDKLEVFVHYLSKLGYTVKINPAPSEDEQPEYMEMLDDSGDVVRAGQINDVSNYVAEILKGKVLAVFTSDEFEELQSKFFDLQRKVEDLLSDNQAIIEMRIQKQFQAKNKPPTG